jgi:hypothetical protein
MRYYIVDTTQSNEPRIFDSLPSLVFHLEGSVQRKFGLTRDAYMHNLISLGYGYDDREGATFTTAMSEEFNIGVVRSGKLLRTNVHEAAYGNKYRQQHGD